MKRQAVGALDVAHEAAAFLETLTVNSRKKVKVGLDRYIRWCEREKIYAPLATPEQARRFVAGLDLTPYAYNTTVAAADRWHGWLKNKTGLPSPFDGVNRWEVSRPARIAHPITPSREEVDAVLAAVKGVPGFAMRLFVYCGLRVGVLNKVKFTAVAYTVEHHGSVIAGELPAAVRDYIQDEKIDVAAPFADFGRTEATDQLRNHLHFQLRQLNKTGVLARHFDTEALRDYFFVNHFKEHGDIYALTKLMWNKTITATGSYLKARGLTEI